MAGGRGRQISEFQASLVYKVSSRTARATQRNPVSKNQKKKKKKKSLSNNLPCKLLLLTLPERFKKHIQLFVISRKYTSLGKTLTAERQWVENNLPDSWKCKTSWHSCSDKADFSLKLSRRNRTTAFNKEVDSSSDDTTIICA
jgi:hypothetical protein